MKTVENNHANELQPMTIQEPKQHAHDRIYNTKPIYPPQPIN